MKQSCKPLAAIHVDLDGVRHIYQARARRTTGLQLWFAKRAPLVIRYPIVATSRLVATAAGEQSQTSHKKAHK